MLPRLSARQKTYSPIPQPYHVFNNTSATWDAVTSPSPSALPHPPSTSNTQSTRITKLKLLTWNIDFSTPYPRARMASALSYLHTLLTRISAPGVAVIVVLQEMMQAEYSFSAWGRSSELEEGEEQRADDVAQIMGEAWVRERFYVSDVRSDTVYWNPRGAEDDDEGGDGGGGGYGQITLIDRRVCVLGVGRMRFVSEFGRSALFVDVRLGRTPHPPDSNSHEEEDKIQERIEGREEEEEVLRVCNVHLDSLSGSLRPIQWEGVARHLIPHPSPPLPSSENAENEITSLVFRSPFLGLERTPQPPIIKAAILAGDTNANRPRDVSAPQMHGFTDAYLALGGVEGSDGGATWGYQSGEHARRRWGVKRMDKVVFWSSGDGDEEVLRVKSIGRIGMGVSASVRVACEGEGDDGGKRNGDENVGSEGRVEEKKVWVTDHYGLMAGFEVGAGWML